MGVLSNLLTWSGSDASAAELPDIYPFPVILKDFVTTDVLNIYARILTDVLERTQGIPETASPLLWDNCVKSEHSDGLVSLVAKAMVDKSDLFLVYDKPLKLIRRATETEAEQIRTDYKAKNGSSIGIFVTFKNYRRTDMVKIYSGLKYFTIAALHKAMNLSKAIQMKLNGLRSDVSMKDSAGIIVESKKIAEGLGNGQDVLLDAKDSIEQTNPDLTATTASMEFISEQLSFYLGLPSSYVTGEQHKGMGDSGNADMKAVERGLRGYYFSVVKPIVETIFGGIKTTFKSDDTVQISSSLDVLKIMEITSDELISHDNKQLIINKCFGLPESEKGDPPEPQPTVEPVPMRKPFQNGKTA